MDNEYLTDLEALQESLALLKEARDMLARMPVNVVVGQLVNKLDAHLESPATRVIEARARRAPLYEGGIYTPVGLPLIEVEVCQDHLYAKCLDYEGAALMVYRRLTQGLEVPLSPVLGDKRVNDFTSKK